MLMAPHKGDSCLWPSKVFLVVFFKLVIPVIGLSLVYPAMILVFDLLKCFSDDLALSSNESYLWPSKVFFSDDLAKLINIRSFVNTVMDNLINACYGVKWCKTIP